MEEVRHILPSRKFYNSLSMGEVLNFFVKLHTFGHEDFNKVFFIFFSYFLFLKHRIFDLFKKNYVLVKTSGFFLTYSIFKIHQFEKIQNSRPKPPEIQQKKTLTFCCESYGRN